MEKDVQGIKLLASQPPDQTNMSTIQESSDLLRCEICQKEYKGRRGLALHQRKCTLIQPSYPSNGSLSILISEQPERDGKVSIADKVLIHSCKKCYRVFRSNNGLKKHKNNCSIYRTEETILNVSEPIGYSPSFLSSPSDVQTNGIKSIDIDILQSTDKDVANDLSDIVTNVSCVRLTSDDILSYDSTRLEQSETALESEDITLNISPCDNNSLRSSDLQINMICDDRVDKQIQIEMDLANDCLEEDIENLPTTPLINNLPNRR